MTSMRTKIYRAIKTSTNKWVLTRGEKILADYTRRRDLVRGFYRLTLCEPAPTKLVDNNTREILAVN